jgi:hypothetical protein
MREMPRADGAIAIYDEDGDDMLVVAPAAAEFTPENGNAFCVCGAPLRRSGWREAAIDSVELGCARCHRVHGRIRLVARVHR